MRICKPNEAGLVFGQGGPMIGGGAEFLGPKMSEKPLGAATPSAGPTAPSVSPSVPSTMNPTFSGQPAQTDPMQGLPAEMCGPAVTAIGAALGARGGPAGAALGAGIADAIKDNMCPKSDAGPAPSTTASAEAGGYGAGSLGNDAYGGMDTSNMC
jgi:hypothetical protein